MKLRFLQKQDGTKILQHTIYVYKFERGYKDYVEIKNLNYLKEDSSTKLDRIEWQDVPLVTEAQP